MSSGTALQRMRRVGASKPLVGERQVRTDRLSALIEGADLRYLSVEGHEVVRRLYVAVRDVNWGTVPGTVRAAELSRDGEAFELVVDVRHLAGEIDFSWTGTLRVDNCGFDFAIHGTAASSFRHNRIGICLLHPAELAGARYRTERDSGWLPQRIGAQRIQSGLPAPTIPAFHQLALEAPGITTEFSFEGDAFELEDQRNWIDASFKTYSTPLSLGFPRLIEEGTSITQCVSCRWAISDVPPRRGTGAPGAVMPKIGICDGDLARLSAADVALLRALSPSHIRVDVYLDSDWAPRFERARSLASEIGAGLEIAVFGDDSVTLEQFARQVVSSDTRIDRIVVLRSNQPCSDALHVAAVRDLVRPEIPVGGGTNVWFTDLNRDRPNTRGFDFVSYSVSPTVHADDDRSLAETCSVVGDTVTSAHALAGGIPVAVSPITLRPRFNPVATSADTNVEAGALPATVDRRQPSLLGAGWTLGVIAGLAASGAATATFFEAVGLRGVVQGSIDSPDRGQFAGEAGATFPLYHVLADGVELAGASIEPLIVTPPFDVAGLWAHHADGSCDLLLANLTDGPVEHTLGVEGRPTSARILDDASYREASHSSLSFRTSYRPLMRGADSIALEPFAYARVKVGHG